MKALPPPPTIHQVASRLRRLAFCAVACLCLAPPPSAAESAPAAAEEVQLTATAKKSLSLKKRMQILAEKLGKGSKFANAEQTKQIASARRKVSTQAKKGWKTSNTLKISRAASLFKDLRASNALLANLTPTPDAKLRKEVRSWQNSMSRLVLDILKTRTSKLSKPYNQTAKQTVQLYNRARKAHTKGNFNLVHRLAGRIWNLAGKAAKEPPPPVNLTLTANRSSSSPGESFELTLTGWKPTKGQTLTWTFDNGQTAQAATSVQVTYDRSGQYAVRATVTHTSGAVLGEASLLLSVLDPSAPVDVAGNPLPGMPGDVDGNGELTLVDALMLRQQLGGAKALNDDDQITRADMDQDGALSEADAELLAHTILMNQMPSSIQPAQGMPGTPFTIRSAKLLDPNAQLSLRFGTAPAIAVGQVMLGQLSAVIPFDVLTPGSFTSDGGTVAIELHVNNTVAETFSFEVLPTGTVDPAAILGSLATLPDRAGAVFTTARQQFDDLGKSPDGLAMGFTPETVSLIQVALAEAEKQQRELLTIILGATQNLTENQKQALARTLIAAGLPALDEQLAQLNAQAMAMASPAAAGLVAGPAVLSALCAIEKTGEIIESTKTTLSWAAAILTTGAVASTLLPEPFLDGPAWIAAATALAKYGAAMEVADLFFLLAPKPGDTLKLIANPGTTLKPGESTVVQAVLPVSIAAEICGDKATEGADELKKRIIKKVLHKYLKSGTGLKVLGKLKQGLGIGTEELFNRLEDTLGTIIGPITSPLDEMIENTANKVCSYVDNALGGITVNDKLVDLSISPAGLTYQRSSDGRSGFTITCPTDHPTPDQHTVTATLDLCGKSVSGNLDITCGETQQVTITMGDDGAALDDIYEVLIDGKSVLTSSSPVTSISTTLDLAVGTYQLAMRGLAAPDGIGTYFISVSGGFLYGGPSESGSDLTAGTEFTWTLEVVP